MPICSRVIQDIRQNTGYSCRQQAGDCECKHLLHCCCVAVALLLGRNHSKQFDNTMHGCCDLFELHILNACAQRDPRMSELQVEVNAENHLAIFLSCLIKNPTFDSPTKETLTTKPTQFGSMCILSKVYYWLTMVKYVRSWKQLLFGLVLLIG